MDDWINKSIKDQKTWLKDQLTRSHLIVDEKLNLLDELQSNFQNIHTEFIVVGILTLLFGILLPLWVIGLATRLLYRAKIELEKKVLSVIKEFSTAHGLYEKPFQSPEFWFKTTSLVLENIALYTSHPGVHTAADLSRHIRQELEKHKN
ncbi:MAG: hypothetical protein KDD50_07835 [Bdellovibrionales bacterium]|nr:hypothetical protein [Bdellovibrionales bacterium]